MKVGIVSLGCAKNLVDSESIAYLFQDNNVDIVNNVEDADIILINSSLYLSTKQPLTINIL